MKRSRKQLFSIFFIVSKLVFVHFSIPILKKIEEGRWVENLLQIRRKDLILKKKMKGYSKNLYRGSGRLYHIV